MTSQEQTILGYTVTLEAFTDEESPDRGAWVDCWVESTCGNYRNSLAYLEGEGSFMNGPEVSGWELDQIAAYACANGY